MITIGTKIKEARKGKGLTQEELAIASTLNLRTIQRIENGASKARGGTLTLLCDALDLNMEEIMELEIASKKTNVGELVIHYFFMGLLNFIIMFVLGITTLDSEANMNSRIAGVLLSVLIPLIIIGWTQHMSRIERLLKFGIGLILYIVFLLAIQGFLGGLAVGMRTMLIPCILIVLCILFYGNLILRIPKFSS